VKGSLAPQLYSNRWQEALRSYWLVVVVYLVVTLLTAAFFMADTKDYADSVIAYQEGRYHFFWDFGHLFWVPLGWVLFATIGSLTKRFIGDDVRSNVILIFMVINWISGLVSVLALRGLLAKFCRQRWIVDTVTIFFMFAQGFLNFSQTGCAYIPGLSLIILGLYILVSRHDQPERHVQTAITSGILFAGAVCMWFLFGLAIPAMILSPVILFGWNRRMWRLTLLSGVAFSFFLAAAYLVVVLGVLHIYTPSAFKAWVLTASHDTDIAGVTRTIFGFARSFIYMGNDGVVFKRYLLRDPLNPVSLLDLFRLSFWKFILFYGFLASIAVNLMRSAEGRKVFYFMGLTSLSVIIFAVFFDGGAIERYLPLYPAIFLGLGVSLSATKSFRALKYTTLAFGVAMILVDGQAMAKPLLDRRQDAAAARVNELQQRIRPRSRIMLVSWQDELVNFSRSFPFNPLNRTHNLSIGSLVTPGTTFVSEWRQSFASETIKAWDQGGEMWVSKRVMSTRPRAEWNWVEGDDRRVSWTDFYTFFSHLELGDLVGGEDGFVMIPPTTHNRQMLDSQLKGSESPETGRKVASG
jgi:hypothetical protein